MVCAAFPPFSCSRSPRATPRPRTARCRRRPPRRAIRRDRRWRSSLAAVSGGWKASRACPRRDLGSVGLCRRDEGERQLCRGQQRDHRPCRGGSHRVRPGQGQLRHTAANLFRGRPRPDAGEPPGTRHRTSYRSAIFPQGPGQQRLARAYIAQINRAGAFARPVATRIERGAFYRAESSHQDFMRRNPRHPYILAHDVPKVRDLKRQFPQYWRD